MISTSLATPPTDQAARNELDMNELDLLYLETATEISINNFLGGSICVCFVPLFQGRPQIGVDSCSFIEQIDLIISLNRYILKFSQKPLFSPQTHTNFPGDSRYSHQTDINLYQFSRSLFSH